MNSEPPAFPKAIDDDDDDVAWALQTAAVQWERGGHADAVVWLRRAAQAAVESGEFGRAADLERGAREVEGWVERGVVGPEPDEDDGVDSLLEGPAIEAGVLEGPTPSLVDLLEAEAREELGSTEDLDEADIEDLPDVQDVEDIESAQSDDLGPRSDFEESERLADGDRPSAVPIPLRSRRPRAASDSPEAATLRPPERAYKLPPPPIPRLPLPAPKRSPPPEPIKTQEQAPEPPGSDELPPAMEPAPLERTDSFGPPTASLELDAPSAPEPRPQLLSEGDPELQSGEIELPPAPPPPPIPAPSARALDPGLLARVRGLEDLPPETQETLAARAKLEVLAPEQEVSGFGLALVTKGSVLVMPTIQEAACGRAVEGEPVFSQGNLAEGVPLRAVAEGQGAELAVWQREDFEHVLRTCPWVAEELRSVADRYQALAGAAMGPLGDRLDDGMRSLITDRAEVRFLAPGETVLEQGKPVAGLLVIGGGHADLVTDGAVTGTLGPGDMPFASAVLSHEKAPASIRGGADGALVLAVDRMATHELLVSVPPLLELLATS